MGRPFWLLATEVMVMVKTLGDANSQRRRAREDCNVNGDHLQRKMEWIQGDTERNYSQAEYGKNALATEVMMKILRAMLIQGDTDSRRH
jgi:hypothetical protein